MYFNGQRPKYSPSDHVHVVCAIDNEYVEHCAVSLRSLFATNRQLSFRITIITNKGLEHRKRAILEEFVRKFAAQVVFQAIDGEALSDMPVSHHVTVATYFRLLIPQLVSPETDKVLFLDSDVIVRQNILPLWNISLDGYSHAAAENPGITTSYKRELGMLGRSAYFNAGVMLINVRAWRNLDVTNKALEFIRNCPDKIKFWDQDALNYVLQDRWLRIDLKWNAQHGLFTSEVPKAVGIRNNEYETARYDPAIVHFSGSGSCKPWHYRCNHPFRSEYVKYRRQTPWSRFVAVGTPPLGSRVILSLKKVRDGMSVGAIRRVWIQYRRYLSA
jgi:lipopolysaccharide biosynthesis glycosyltransferase